MYDEYSTRMYSVCWVSSISGSHRHKTLSRSLWYWAVWGHLGVFGEFGHVFSLISAANQSGGATQVALFYVPG